MAEQDQSVGCKQVFRALDLTTSTSTTTSIAVFRGNTRQQLT